MIGRNVEEKMFCSNCGKEIDGDAKFCPRCGKTVGADDDAKTGGAKASVTLMDKIKSVVAAGIGVGAGIIVLLLAGLLVCIPVVAVIGVIPTAVLAVAIGVVAIAKRFGETHYKRLIIAALVVVAQIGFLYMANHNAQSVQDVKGSAVYSGSDTDWETFASSVLQRPRWSIERTPKNGTYFVKLTGRLQDVQTGKKLKTKVHFSVKVSVSEESVGLDKDVNIESVYIKGFGEGSDAMQAFKSLVYQY